MKIDKYAVKMIEQVFPELHVEGGRDVSKDSDDVKGKIKAYEAGFMGKYRVKICCWCCGDELQEHEEDKLDCGHYACNNCTYENSLRVMTCAICKEDEGRDETTR